MAFLLTGVWWSAGLAMLLGRSVLFAGRQGGMEDLTQVYAHLLTPGSWLSEARAITPDGHYIAGWGYNAATRRFEGYLLDTIPEPASLLVLGTGLTGLLLRRRTR